jgi:hypothetical protein
MTYSSVCQRDSGDLSAHLVNIFQPNCSVCSLAMAVGLSTFTRHVLQWIYCNGLTHSFLTSLLKSPEQRRVSCISSRFTSFDRAIPTPPAPFSTGLQTVQCQPTNRVPPCQLLHSLPPELLGAHQGDDSPVRSHFRSRSEQLTRKWQQRARPWPGTRPSWETEKKSRVDYMKKRTMVKSPIKAGAAKRLE